MRLGKKLYAVLAVFLLALVGMQAAVTYVGDVQGHVNVMDFGAHANVADDSTQAFTDAALYVKRRFNGGVVQIPAGQFSVTNVPLIPGVEYKGAGGSHEGGGSATIVKLPANAAAGSSVFRLYGALVDEYFDGGGLRDLEINGQCFSGDASMPTAPTTTVEAEKKRGLDFRQSTRYLISAVDTTNDIVTTSSNHNVVTGLPVNVSIGSGGTLPTGLSAQPTYYYGRAVAANQVSFYDTSAHATAGGATGRVDITAAGAGTFYVARTIVGIHKFNIDHCYFHHLDEGVRGSCIIDRSLVTYSSFKYCYVGFQGQEHPHFVYGDFRNCYLGLTGRFSDMILGDTNTFAYNYYGLAPYGTDNGGSSYKFNSSASFYLNNCRVAASFFKNVVGLTISNACTVPPGTLIVGSDADITDYPYSGSIGVRIQGNNNIVAGEYGEGTAGDSFGKAAIMFDKGGNQGQVLSENQIISANFNLACGECIIGGDTNQTTPLFSSGSWGACHNNSVRNCVADIVGQRFIFMVSANGTCQYWNVSNNSIYLSTGGTTPIGATDGIMEGAWYTGTEFSDNRVYNVNAACGSAIEGSPTNLTGVRFVDNQFVGTFSQTAIKTPVSFSGCYFKGNSGYVSEAKGEVMLAGTTPVNVAHTLAQTPLISDVQLTPQADVGSGVRYWVSAVDGTNITVVASGASTAKLNWSVRLSP